MRIHVSEPCKNLLPAQFKFEQRDDPEVKEKVGGLNSYFLNSKDGRQGLLFLIWLKDFNISGSYRTLKSSNIRSAMLWAWEWCRGTGMI